MATKKVSEFNCSFPLCRKGMLRSRNTVLACPKDQRQIVRK